MKKTIAILGITVLGLTGVSTAHAGVSVRVGAGVHLAPPVIFAPAPHVILHAPTVAAAPLAPAAPIYGAPAPAVVYHQPIARTVVAPAPVYVAPPQVVVVPPRIHIGLPSLHIGLGFGHRHHHRIHRHCR